MNAIDERLLDRALGAYLGLACGDALGATVEFMSPKKIQQHYGIHRDIIGGGWLGLQAGQVTDDTQMSLALGQAIIDHRGWNLHAVADNFVAWMETEPPDVGNTCRRGLLRYRNSGQIHGEPRDDDAGNGACMRNLPVALATWPHAERQAAWSLEQCRITHHHPLSDAATVGLARMVSLFLQGEGLETASAEAEGLIARHAEFGFSPYPGKASAYIVDTVQTVLHHFFSTDSFEACLVATVNQGGDADTTGALAGMLAGAHYGLKQIPERWLGALDQTVAEQIRLQTEELIRISLDCDSV